MSKIKYFLYIFVIFVLVFFGTRFYKSVGFFDDYAIYFPFVLLSSIVFISVREYICCNIKHKCEKTHSQKLGFVSLSIIVSLMLFSFVGSLNILNKYIMLSSENIVQGLFFYNPIILFYLMYLYLSKILIQKD
jgi:hypothetical protein